MAKKKTVKKKVEKVEAPIEIKEEFKVDKYKASYFSKGREHSLGMFATKADAVKALDKAGAYSRKIKHITK